MPKKKRDTSTPRPEFCFADELRGENPPSFEVMKDLYEIAGTLFALRPWDLLDEDQMLLVRQPDNENLCYCSAMGAIGQVFSMHAYIGAEAYRMFRRVSDGIETDPAEFLAAQNCVYVEFVPRSDLEAADRRLLAALGHPSRKGAAAPIFRAIRPGYHPWHVTAEEAVLLAACLRAVVSVCSEIVRTGKANYWPSPNVFPLFVADGNSWHIEPIEPALPSEPAPAPARLGPEEVAWLHGKDYPVRGTIELDYFVSPMAVGAKKERKACTAMAMAVDASSGILYHPELAHAQIPAGDLLARAVIGVIRATGAFPSEIRLRDQRKKECLAPLAESLRVRLRVVPRLPALDEARESMLRYFAR